MGTNQGVALQPMDWSVHAGSLGEGTIQYVAVGLQQPFF